MHLVSLQAQTVTVAGSRIQFAEGESIWTESSYKFDALMLDRLAAAAGFTVARRWTDAGDRFWVAFLEVA
jgi:uncharacterized SAM-dependent methyltransferase